MRVQTSEFTILTEKRVIFPRGTGARLVVYPGFEDEWDEAMQECVQDMGDQTGFGDTESSLNIGLLTYVAAQFVVDGKCGTQ